MTMELFKIIFSWDEKLLLWIHNGLEHPYMDAFFITLTNLHNHKYLDWVALAALIFYIWKRRKLLAIPVVIVLSLTGALSDSLGYRVFKESVARPRPNHRQDLAIKVKLPHSPTSYSFPSNHALNSAAVGATFVYFFPGAWLWVSTLVVLIGFSRVYVGVHYPTDVLGGFFLGLLLARLFRAYGWGRFHYFRSATEERYKAKI